MVLASVADSQIAGRAVVEVTVKPLTVGLSLSILCCTPEQEKQAMAAWKTAWI